MCGRTYENVSQYPRTVTCNSKAENDGNMLYYNTNYTSNIKNLDFKKWIYNAINVSILYSKMHEI